MMSVAKASLASIIALVTLNNKCQAISLLGVKDCPVVASKQECRSTPTSVRWYTEDENKVGHCCDLGAPSALIAETKNGIKFREMQSSTLSSMVDILPKGAKVIFVPGKNGGSGEVTNLSKDQAKEIRSQFGIQTTAPIK